MNMLRRCGVLRTVIALGVFMLLAAPAAAQLESLEYPLKATYLYKFGPFVEWPDSAFGGPTAAINICIVGVDPFGYLLDRAIEDQRIGARRIVVRRMAAVEGNNGCHMMYMGGSDGQTVREALGMVRGHPVLTVTDAARDPDAKGIIHFVVQANRVRFEIDSAAAAANGIVLSSKLLRLAVSAKPGS